MADQNVNLGTIFTGKVSGAFNKATADVKKAVNGIADVQKKATRASENATKATKKQAQTADTLTKHIKSQSKAYQKLAKGTKEQANSYKELTTRAIRVVAVYGSLAMVMSTITDAFTGGLQAITDYDQALKNLQAITGATDTEVEGLGDTMRQVAADTKYSISEMSEGMILLGQAGFSAKEAMEGMEAVAVLATGTLSDMQNSSDLLTTAIRAFGLQTSDSMKVADIFASAVNKSKLTIDKLRTSFNYIGPAAHKAGLSLEETASATMVLANSGLRASTIGTGLRQVIARLVAPNAKLREAYNAQGIDLERLNPLTNEFADIIDELTRVVPTAQKAFELFGLRGASAVSALTEAGRAGFEGMLKEVYRSNVAFEMAEKQMEGLGVKTKNLKDRMGILAVAIGRAGVDGALSNLVETLREAVGGLIKFVESPVGKVIVWATMIATLTAAISALVIGVKLAAAAIMGFLIMRGVFAPKVLAMVVVLVALAAAYRALYRDIGQSLKQHREMFMSYTSLGEAVEKYNKEINKLNNSSSDTIRLNEDLKRTLKKVVKEEGELSEAAQKVIDTFDAMGGSTEETIKALKKFEDLRVKEEFKELGGITEDLIDTQTRAHNKLYKFAGVFDSLKSVVSFCTGDFKAFSKQIDANEKGLDKATRALRLHAREIVDSVLKLNDINLFAPIEEFEKLAISMGIPEDKLKEVLPHIKTTLDELQKIARKGASGVNDEFLRAIDPKLVTREAKKITPAIEREWKNITKATINLTEEQLSIFKKYWYTLSNDARANLAGLVSVYDVRFGDVESRGLDHSTKMELIAKNTAQAEIDVEKVRAKDISTARAAQYKSQKEELALTLDHELILIDASYDQRLSIVEKGSKEECTLISKLAIDKTRAIEDSYNSQLAGAKTYYSDMMLLAGSNVEKQEKALGELLSTERGLTDQRISTYRSMYDQFVSMAQAGTEKEKSIRLALVDIEKKISEERQNYAKTLFDYESDLVTKINAIKKRGLKGVEKERFNEQEALDNLTVANQKLQEAITNKDEVALHGAKKSFQNASNLYGSLENQRKAIEGITDASNGLKQIEGINHQKRLAELDEEKKAKQDQLALVQLQTKTYKMLYEVLAKIINSAADSVGKLRKELEIAPDTSKTVTAVKKIETAVKDIKKESDINIEVDDNFIEVTMSANDAKDAINDFDKALAKKPTTDVVSTVGEDVDKVKGKVQELHKTIDEPKIMDVGVDVDMDEVSVAVTYLDGLVTKSLHIPVANITRAVDVINQLTKTTHSTHIVHVVEVSGKKDGGMIQKFATGGGVWPRLQGALGGFGGGDKVKAMLEPGEFIMRKEAVQAYGSGLMNAINNLSVPNVGDAVSGALKGAGVAKMATGGIVGNQTQEERMYNFNLNLGGTNLKGKATSGTLDAFQRDLRRLELSRGL